MSHPWLQRIPDRPLGRRTAGVLLALLLLWSLALRIWFGLPGLHPNRFWDERFGLGNIGPVLRGQGLRPSNGFHPSLSWLPQAALLGASEALHRKTGLESLAVLSERSFTPTAYFLCRLSQALLGTLSLVLLFLIGCRMGGRRAGFLAALLLATVPWHIRQSGAYRPDVLLVLTLLVVFWLSMKAADSGAPRAYAAAGAAIGLALSTKFNAGPIAVPLCVAALMQLRRNRRTLLWLALAGLIALGVFLALNPWVLTSPEIYERDFGRTRRDYYAKGLRRGTGGRFYLLWHAVASLLSDGLHGPLIGALGLAGLVLLALLAVRGGWREPPYSYGLMALSYVLAYVGFYAAATTNPSQHNWLPLTPFTALGAAWLLDLGWRLARIRLPLLGRPWPRAVVAAGFVLLVAWPGSSYTYRTLVPTTADVAGLLIKRNLVGLNARLLYSEHPIRSSTIKKGNQLPAVVLVDRLDRLDARELEGSDGEVFLKARLETPDRGSFYRGRFDRVPAAERILVESRPFALRGPSLVLLLHPLTPAGRESGLWQRSSSDPSVYQTDALRDARPGQLVSLEYWLPHNRDIAVGSEVVTGELRLPSIAYRLRREGRALHITSRFVVTGEPVKLVLDTAVPDLVKDTIPFVVWTWQPAGEQGD